MKEDTLVIDELAHNHWIEDVDADLPDTVTEGKKHGQLPAEFKQTKVQIGVRELPNGKEVHFKALLTDSLREVFERGAQALGKPLLPPAGAIPLDLLRCRERAGQGWSDPITNLEQPLWLALAGRCSRHFGIEYVLAVKINTKWGIAPSPNATPRELLTSFGFDPSQFSLYKANSSDLLPPDTPLDLKRGDEFEAQKDGRYGAPVETLHPPRGVQTIEDDVEALQEAGINARLFVEGGQKYVEVRGIRVPSPPWSPSKVNILIAVPATYPTGGLDAFYVEMKVQHISGSIPNLQSVVQLDGRSWGLISWHYATNRPWNAQHDDLASHIEHCRGAFLR